MPDSPAFSIYNKIRIWARQAGEWMAPPSEECVYCQATIRSCSNPLGLCDSCYSKIPWITEIECEQCGRAESCSDCVRRKETYFVRNRSAVKYDPVMKDLLALYKYRGNERLLSVFSAMLVHAFNLHLQRESLQVEDFQCITYVPVNEERLEERGFNQAECFASGLAAKLGLPHRGTLIRTRNTPKQSFKSRKERLSDLEDAFTLHPSVYEDPMFAPFPGRPALKILLIDDVYTTGSTLNQCSRLLSSSLNARVYGLTWAR
ncbi:ComF family protein [Paenibacillus sp. J2TS4]|uniref:ComF family protein n=1 Tax=Paenibacillus sp. J2TS4 TaxID=2807194 RepID=UPI001B20BF9D|nr:ComF family protein [Paenibacillus sp. J2TS4]GIP35592.1 amidophosphoribosyltransferase [Paenibacillus sp. J2TS4]